MAVDPLVLLFGKSGELYPPLLKTLVMEVSSVNYEILEEDNYKDLLLKDPLAANQTYWREILYRAHWAAGSSLLRNKRWIDGCLGAFEQGNYLAFGACLRGLLESAADTKCSLQHIPRTLAENYYLINRLLLGKSKKLLLSEEVEDLLIHFQYARKLKKGEPAPDTHEALHMAKYIDALTQPNLGVKSLYAELCNLAHPAAQSLMWLTKCGDGQYFWIEQGDDRSLIVELCQTNLVAIETIVQESVNIAVFLLKVLNEFPIKTLHGEMIRRVEVNHFAEWKKIEAALSSGHP